MFRLDKAIVGLAVYNMVVSFHNLYKACKAYNQSKKNTQNG